MNISAAKYWLLLACLLATIYGTFLAWRRSQSEASLAAVASPAAISVRRKPLEHFTLTDQSGQPFDSQSLRGQVWIGSFFFTNCPAICWRMNQALATLKQTDPASQVRLVSITCDPENDTPAALAKYAERFQAKSPEWVFLTGGFSQIRRIGNDFFQVGVEQGTHSDRAFVVDREGRVRGRFRVTEPDQFEMLKKLVAVVEAEAPAEASPAAAQPPADEAPSAT
ncbi:MAG TPA: SCO family protein [Pirellulales bacterium]|jgi:cytochrome oxidase Cu insertion factor (SCO1/SenC/PrrC family)|nr:SCO family protein [Pirellulales bacterium]